MEIRRQAVVLAAGDGKRMKSAQPKVLCRVLDRPMLGWVEEACRQAGIQDIIIVAGDRPELLAPAVTADCRFVQQRQRLGTGHAVLSALELLDPLAQVAVVCGDAPLLRPEDLQAAYELHLWEQNVVTLLSARLEDPTGYGRVLRRPDGAVEAIVEANTYLSGVGADNGGLAVAHSVYNGFTALEELTAMHGEVVAYGTLAQLLLEDGPTEEFWQVHRFCRSVGLPVTLAEMGITDKSRVIIAAEKACAPGESIHNMAWEISPKNLEQALLSVDALSAQQK